MDESNHIGELLALPVLEELDRLWPDRCPPVSATADERLIASAQREVINVLWARYHAANDPQQDPSL